MKPDAGFVDLHIHALPGLDDGPYDLGETVELLHAAYRGGTRTIVATPHLYHSVFPEVEASLVRERFSETVAALRDMSTAPKHAFLAQMRLGLGAENSICSEFLDDLEAGTAITLNQSRNVLVEFSSFFPYDMIRAALSRIQDCGYRPVVAHIERYPALMDHREGLDYLVEAGCIMQVNAESLLGGRLSASRRLVARLIKNGRVQVLASDGHNTLERPPALDAAALVARRLAGRDFAVQALRDLPRELVGDVPCITRATSLAPEPASRLQ